MWWVVYLRTLWAIMLRFWLLAQMTAIASVIFSGDA
jgi:hypothetical protein